MKHENYEILNLIGYGLSKFNNAFINKLGFTSKTDFYNFCVDKGIAETPSVIKNRQDLFDPFFDNGRKGWWQSGDAYLHRKILIDSFYGELTVKPYTNIIRLFLFEKKIIPDFSHGEVSPILKSKFKQLQETGREAEFFFMSNFEQIPAFAGGELEDGRLFGDGYDFQVKVASKYYLAEIKGLRKKTGGIRMTANEFKKAKEFKNDYALIIVANLVDVPTFKLFYNPAENLEFKQSTLQQEQVYYSSFISN